MLLNDTEVIQKCSHALGTPRIHRSIVNFPNVLSTSKIMLLLEESEGYHAKCVYIVEVRGNDGNSQTKG